MTMRRNIRIENDSAHKFIDRARHWNGGYLFLPRGAVGDFVFFFPTLLRIGNLRRRRWYRPATALGALILLR